MAWLILWLSLGGCSWLNDVPEERIVLRTSTAPAERVRDPDQADSDDEVDDWNPVSIPIVPKNPTPVEFKSASGKPITGRTTHKDNPGDAPADVNRSDYTPE